MRLYQRVFSIIDSSKIAIRPKIFVKPINKNYSYTFPFNSYQYYRILTYLLPFVIECMHRAKEELWKLVFFWHLRKVFRQLIYVFAAKMLDENRSFFGGNCIFTIRMQKHDISPSKVSSFNLFAVLLIWHKLLVSIFYKQ